jgi:drug/metabolite transporter (DMT)-like permease
MSTAALGLALGAAFLHAFWNLLLARAPNVEAATAVALVAGLLCFAPVAAAAWDVEARVWPFIVVTSIFQLAYFLLLAAAYGRAELSFVYPVARGTAPVLVLLASIAVLGTGASATQVAGVLLVSTGVLLVRGVRGRATAADLGLALAIAACICSYTLIDKHGIRYASPVVYQELSMIPAAAVFLGITLARFGAPPVRRAMAPAPVAAGLAAFGGYVLVLAALARAPAASVAAVRETSIVIATALAAPILGERVGPVRLTGAVLVVAGVALLGA